MPKNDLPPPYDLNFNNVTTDDGNLEKVAVKTVPPSSHPDSKKSNGLSKEHFWKESLLTPHVSSLPSGHPAETTAWEIEGRKECFAKNDGKATKTEDSTMNFRGSVEYNPY